MTDSNTSFIYADRLDFISPESKNPTVYNGRKNAQVLRTKSVSFLFSVAGL
jgi:hypothetical protein